MSTQQQRGAGPGARHSHSQVKLTAGGVSYMRVTVIGRYFMNVEQGLVDALLQLQGAVQGLHGTAPLVPVGLLPNTWTDASNTTKRQLCSQTDNVHVAYNVKGVISCFSTFPFALDCYMRYVYMFYVC